MGEAFAQEMAHLLRGNELFEIISRTGIEYSPLVAHMKQIRASGNPMERRLRFQADGMGLATAVLMKDRDLAHWEAKASASIEREPYLFLMEYEKRGEPVLLFTAPGLCERDRPKRGVFVCRMKDLALHHGRDSEARHDRPAPVDADGWIRWDLDPEPWRFKGSRTPHREIDFYNSKMLILGFAQLKSNTKCDIEFDFLVSDTIRRAWNGP